MEAGLFSYASFNQPNVRHGEGFKKEGALDLSRINVNEADEVRYWTEALVCSEDELVAAVARVGNSSDAVRLVRFLEIGHMEQSDATLLSHGDEDDLASEGEPLASAPALSERRHRGPRVGS
jgi:Protein of unknown function (DUF3606)